MAKHTISLAQYKAVIFDMDGTMIDNMAFHKKAWAEYLKRHNLELTEEEFKQKISGKNNAQIFSELFENAMTEAEILRCAEEKEAIYRELYADDIVEIAGLSQLLHSLKKHGIRTAIATTAIKSNRDFGLRALGLESAFEVVVGDEDVKNGKPNPEIYLEAASRLELNPEECLVFEDSPVGVQAAKDAGMTVIGLLTSHKETDLLAADYLVDDFTKISVE